MNELQEVKDQLNRLETKLDNIFISAEKTRKYFKATLIVTVVTIVLPAIGLMFVIPLFLKTLTGTGSGIENINSLGL